MVPVTPRNMWKNIVKHNEKASQLTDIGQLGCFSFQRGACHSPNFVEIILGFYYQSSI